MSAGRILVVEDEEPLRMALCDALRAEGFDVLEAADGVAGRDAALREDPDLVLLDLMLPKLDGFGVLSALRADRLSAPVVILSARGEEWDRIQGFEVGADDYVVKPFSMRELLLRVRALLARESGGAPGIAGERRSARFGEVVVDFAGYSLTFRGERRGLSRKELDLLRFFLEHEGEVLERDRILDGVWGRDEFPSTRTVDMHVLKLRRKLEADPERPAHLQTVHGVGYKFLQKPDLGAR
ncbi:MAG: response regulator transcription factor [Planctomycetes bacterium]|nr:response regulator transcription factor [Planctomycetota bacterium]